MEIIGRLFKILPIEEVTFASDNAVRKAQTFVVSTEQSGSGYVAFRMWGDDRIAQLSTLAMGSLVRVNFNAKSRENPKRPGNYITDLTCTMVMSADAAPSSPSTPASQMAAAGAPTNEQTFGAVPPTVGGTSSPFPIDPSDKTPF